MQDRQCGATLIEVLVTMVIVAVGLLGAAGLQLASIRYEQTAIFRTQALVHLQQIREKISANILGVSGGAYLAPDDYSAAASQPADPGCGLGGQPDCTPAQAAQRDLREWRRNLARELPGGRGAIFQVLSAGPTARRIFVMWNEKPDSDNNIAGGAIDPTCPPTQVAGIRCLSWVITP